ncbi:protein phosphatase [Brevundimonas sp. AAP58]|uniref:bifunctional protein-serine/threonine kinase/phosphatase n=1 Tax=Brevundimonas sp. AAP58 TaxID=1523422 RepID=UPI0006B987B5|nr:bifunctional protein-serine/threonine kinase/phosphatase [Brevundimonas sp. AAP58]KPF79836.1 protein phosphatase [Brevundimonas sp. AAP58]
MSADARLQIAAGFATAKGPRADNQDFGAVHIGPPSEQALHGMVALVADGVSGSKAGRIASELAGRTFIDAYVDQNPLKGVAAAGVAALSGYNRWLHAKGRSDPEMAGAATTFTALVMRGREATVLHVGDSRAWHFRDGVLTPLTEDHVLAQPGLSHVLYRAVGIEPDLRLDTRAVTLKAHDRLLLTTDGVHGVVPEADLTRLLARRASPQADAQAIVAAAGAAETRDNATAIVIDVIRPGAVDQDAIGAEAAGLPILPVPDAGDRIDGFTLERVLSDGKYTRVFAARDGEGGDRLVLKFPKPALLSESGARGAFLRESFIGRRIDSPFVGKTLSLEPGRQSGLYIAQPLYVGRTLHAKIADEPYDIASGLDVAIRLSKGVAALHRLGVAHRDIKPDNVILEADGGLKLIDLGVARLPRVEEFAEAEAPGTPGYRAPEMFAGNPGDALTDQYALGVTLYRIFTGDYPSGQETEFSRIRFDRPTRPTQHRPDMPAWLEAAILRALSVDPADRFDSVEELIHVLEAGSAAAVPPRRDLSLMEREPVRFWQAVSAGLFVLLLLSWMLR